MQYETDVHVYEMNQVTLYAVQGEANSRTLIFNIIEKSGVQIPTSNAIVVDKMLDLTEYTAKFYVIRPDSEVVFCAGTLTDAQSGQVSFKLSKACAKVSGICECVIVLTNGDKDLRVVGISLQVATCNIDGNSNNSSGIQTSENILKVFATEMTITEAEYKEVNDV